MAKLDWSKTDIYERDPARAQRDARSFPPTKAAKKEFEAKKKARSQAAKKAAVTRKRNREIAEERARDAAEYKEREKAFFDRLREQFRARNEGRRAKREAKAHRDAGSLGKVLSDALKGGKAN